MTKRVAILIRVSTEEQTVENQRLELEEMARARGYTVVGVYTEEGVSGASQKRPELDRLMNDARRSRFEVVLIWALDRLGRTTLEMVGRVTELDRIGVRMVSAKEPWLDTEGPARELLLLVMSWAAQQERQRIIERTKAGLARAKAQGKRLGRKPVAINRFELAQLIDAGMSPGKIAKKLGCARSTVQRRTAEIRAVGSDT